MIPKRATHLLNREIGEGYSYLINTWESGTLKIINSTQQSILNEINGKYTTTEIAEKLKVPIGELNKFLHTLAEKRLVEIDDIKIYNSKTAQLRSLNLWIHTTNKCNLGCSYCYISTLQTTGGMSIEVSNQLTKKILETVKNKQLKHVKIKLAGGEPMTQFANWKDYIVSLNQAFNEIDCKLTISFLTNLTILNPEIIEFAKTYNIHFGISLDGFGKYHDQTRKMHNGRGTFEIVDKNIDKLTENGVKFSISSVVTQENMTGLEALTSYLIQKRVNFRYSIVRGEIIDRTELLSHLTKAYDLMEKAVEQGWSFSRYHKLNDLKPFELGSQTCSSGNSGGAVYVNGDMYYCHVQFGTNMGKNGNIFNENLDLLDLIKLGSYNEGYQSEDCKTCKYRHICTSGCPMYRTQGKDPNCHLYHQMIPRIFDLQAKERLHLILNGN